MSEYESVQKGALKLKGGDSVGIKKKKKKKSKDKDKEKAKKVLEQISSSEPAGESSRPKEGQPYKTKAEMAFMRAKEKRSEEDMAKKASLTHKERIMLFNEKLDQLTEHYDIPKVSWTK